MGKKILVADDDPEIQDILNKALLSADYEVRVCDTGRVVEQAIAEFQPDLLLLDVMLPGLDGHTLVQKISANPATAALPIIMVSGLEPSLAMFGKFKQVTAYLHKPFDTQELLDAVAKGLLPG